MGARLGAAPWGLGPHGPRKGGTAVTTRDRPRGRARLALAAGSAMLGCAWLVVGVGSARAAFPGANGRIAFAVERWGQAQDPRADPVFLSSRIETVLPHGRGRRVVHTPPAGEGCCIDTELDWSPSGRLLAFTEGGRLAIVRHNGAGLRLLPQLTEADGAPAWAPGGRRLAFHGQLAPDDYPSIYAVRTDGTGLRRLTPEWATSPAWSARGTIAFVNDDEPDSWRHDGIYTISTDGSGLRRLFGRYWGTGNHLDWSPRGSRLAFSARQHIFSIKRDSRGLRRLTDRDSSGNGHPAWSPDGRYIAFLRSDVAYRTDATLFRTGLYVMRSNGRRPRRVLETRYTLADQEYEVLGPPSWQPLRR
jgi:Tol biopolymer transport system component